MCPTDEWVLALDSRINFVPVTLKYSYSFLCLSFASLMSSLRQPEYNLERSVTTFSCEVYEAERGLEYHKIRCTFKPNFCGVVSVSYILEKPLGV